MELSCGCRCRLMLQEAQLLQKGGKGGLRARQAGADGALPERGESKTEREEAPGNKKGRPTPRRRSYTAPVPQAWRSAAQWSWGHVRRLSGTLPVCTAGTQQLQLPFCRTIVHSSGKPRCVSVRHLYTCCLPKTVPCIKQVRHLLTGTVACLPLSTVQY